MNTPVNHHYIPRMLSKRFANQDGKLHVYDKNYPHRGVQKKDPRKVFVKRRLYTQEEEDGKRDASVETEYLAPLESDASPIVEKIVNSARRGGPLNLSPDERRIWGEFYYNLFARVPDTLDTATDMAHQMVLAEIDFVRQSRPLNDSELSLQNSPETMERNLKKGRIQHLQRPHPEGVSELLSNMRFVVAVIRKPRPERSFIIGSKPIMNLTTLYRSYLIEPSATVWLPLARDVGVSFCPGESDKIISLQDRHIKPINRSVFQQSTVIAGCSRELIESVLGEGE